VTYIAQHRIDAGSKVYEVGEEISEELVDEAMLEAGSVAVDRPEPRPYYGLTKAELITLCEARDLTVPERVKVDELKAMLEAGDGPGVSAES
jgi:hypothetical protein